MSPAVVRCESFPGSETKPQVRRVEVLGSYSNPSTVSRLRKILAGQSDNRVSDRSRRSRQIQRHLDADEVLSLLGAHAQGDTLDELAAAFGIHRTTVMAHLERQGAPRRSGIVTKNINEATRLYEAGWSLAQVGERLHVDGEPFVGHFERLA
jgi:hypothetical protein